MNAKDVEKYILLGYEPKKGRSVKRGMIYSACWRCFFSMFFFMLVCVATLAEGWVVDWITYPLAIRENLGIALISPMIVMFLLIPITIKRIPNYCKRMIDNIHEHEREESRQGNRLGYGFLGIAIGGFLIRSFIPRLTDNGVLFFSFALFAGVGLMIFHTACERFYIVRLIKEYCPHLSTDDMWKWKKK